MKDEQQHVELGQDEAEIRLKELVYMESLRARPRVARRRATLRASLEQLETDARQWAAEGQPYLARAAERTRK